MSKKNKMMHYICTKCSKRCKNYLRTEDTMVGCSGHSEIIPKKPKMVRMKAWAEFVPDKNYCLPWLAWEKSDRYNIPCTILIDEKHLRRKP